MEDTTTLRKLKLLVDRRWLYMLSGVMWSGVGVMLCVLAYTWLSPLDGRMLLFGLIGLIAAFIIFRFGFSKIAAKNIQRIDSLRQREPFYAFQGVKSYATIVFMMGLGMTLRHSPLPKSYLAILYTGIGGGLFLSSLRYYLVGFAA